MNGERLQLGRDKRPSPGRRPDEGGFARTVQWWQQRRAAKKRRMAAMTPTGRWLYRGAVAGTWMLAFITVLCLAALVMFYAFTDVPRPENVALPQVATVEYADGTVLARVGYVNRTIVSLDKVPDTVRWAVLAAEDRGFYGEPGVSFRGTVRAAVSDLFGGDTQGGSGITQQYVKNAYLTDARSVSRKLKELMIAIKLSREYTKNQILEYYLNTVYFGRGAYGIGAAARTYFNTDVSKLTTAQGAVLAALLRAPSYYDPAQNRQAAVDRWNYVLDGMVSIGHLDANVRAAMRYPDVQPPKDKALGAQGWRWLLVNRIFAELQAHGITEKDIYNNGLVIRTTINRRAQQAAVDAIHTMNASLTPKQRTMKNALVAVNPANGAVLAYYGGTGLNVKGPDGKYDYNDYAGVGTRPPGSSFKPYTLATVLQRTVQGQKPGYAINSYVDGSYCLTIEATPICNDPSDRSASSSRVTLKSAIMWSLNTTFDLLASQVGPEKVAATAHAMGIPDTDYHGAKLLQDRNGHTTFGIGIGDYPVSPIDQAVGFATLANGGVRNDAFLVQSATTSTGQLYYQHQANPHRAIDPTVANDVTLALEPVAGFSQVPLAGGRVSAAKTGTEGLGPRSSDNSDAWMVGYTPQVSAAVWVGTGFNKPIYDASGSPEYGRDLPGRTWKAFMDEFLANKPALPMATEQKIQPAFGVYSQPSSVPVTTSAAPPSSPSPSPSVSIKSGFSSSTIPPPTSSTPPRTSSSTAPPPTTQSSCGHVLQPPCPSTTAGGG